MIPARGRMFPNFRQPSVLELQVGLLQEDADHAQMVSDHCEMHAYYLEQRAEKAEISADANPDDEVARQYAEMALYEAEKAREEADEEEEYASYLWKLIHEKEALLALEKAAQAQEAQEAPSG